MTMTWFGEAASGHCSPAKRIAAVAIGTVIFSIAAIHFLEDHLFKYLVPSIVTEWSYQHLEDTTFNVTGNKVADCDLIWWKGEALTTGGADPTLLYFVRDSKFVEGSRPVGRQHFGTWVFVPKAGATAYRMLYKHRCPGGTEHDGETPWFDVR